MKKINLFLILGMFLLAIGMVSAVSYCCEKTIDTDENEGIDNSAWCQPSEEGISCDDNYEMAQGSCEMTEFCKTGTCIDENEGSCSSAQKTICTRNGGRWDGRAEAEVPECQEGCCFVAGQSFLATRAECGILASVSERKMVFDDALTDELECIRSGNPNVKGACVFIDEEGVQTCEMITQGECNENHPDGTFHQGYLCSASELNTNCAPRGGTKCYENKVYFLDTCGELANVYDSSKLNDGGYWTYIRDSSCGDANNPANKNSASCGNCDFQLGSVCSEKKAGETVNWNKAEHICRDVDCHDYVGEGFSSTHYPQHGEIWCASTPGVRTITSNGTDLNGGINFSSYNLPGSQYIKKACMNGKVTSYLCEETRNEICVESLRDDGLKFAKCRANNWESCYIQTNKADCETKGLDCVWAEGFNILWTEEGESMAVDEEGVPTNASCIPKYAPGFKHWDGGGEQCKYGTRSCVVTYNKNILHAVSELFTGVVDISKLSIEDKKEYCVGNCDCLDEQWKQESNAICSKLGDCGVKTNYIGNEGEEKGDVIRFSGKQDVEE